MKFRWLASAVALATFSAAPWMQAQTPAPTQDPSQQQPQTQQQPQQPQSQPPASDPDQGQPKASDVQNAPPQKPAALPTQDDSQIKHDGGKTDVDAVGNRNVGCGRGVGNWYTVEGQVARGRQYAQMIESQIKLINDPVILAADEEAEMAGVMAHEIAHVAACHYGREMTRANLMQLMSLPAIFMGGWIGYGIYEGAGLGIPLTFLKFSRGFEAEADYLGIEYMYRAGYDPSAFVSFFEKIQAMEKKKPGTLSKAFDSHPQTPDRIEKSQEEIRKILPAKQQYIVTTSEFDEVKARLAAIENKHKVIDQKDSNKPSLRRTSNPSDNTGNQKTDDDRPTLKRRDDSN